MSVATPLPADAEFLPHEHWAWSCICSGQEADMRLASGEDDGASPEIGNFESWPKHRVLSAAFMRAIMFREPWASARERAWIAIRNARFSEPLFWTKDAFKGELRLVECVFDHELVWRDLSVDGLISLRQSRLQGGLFADGLTSSGGLFCTGVQVEGAFRVLGARIGGAIDLSEGCFREKVLLDEALIDGACYIRHAEMRGALSLSRARIAGNLDLSESAFSQHVDLSAVEVQDSLVFGHFPPRVQMWADSAELVLTDASAGRLVGGLGCFRLAHSRKAFVPCRLNGFVYRRLGHEASTLARDSTQSLLRWLRSNRPSTYEPEPYRQLAAALRAANQPQKADSVMYALGEYHRTARGTPLLTSAALWVASVVAGYGYRFHRAGFVFVGMVFVAAGLGYWANLTFASADTPSGWSDLQAWLDWLGFSLGAAVPVVTLDRGHETFLTEKFGSFGVPLGLIGFFYGVKVLGLIFGYLASGLARIGQR